jgi:protein involved in ribonucleotide reduction
MIAVVYDSMTGQGKRFAEKLGYPTFDIQHYIPRPLDHVFLISQNHVDFFCSKSRCFFS